MAERRLFSAIEKIYKTVLILMTIAMFCTVTYNVFMRFVMNRSVGWADELARFIFIWMSFLGAVLAFKNNEHVGLGFIVDKIKSPFLVRIVGIIQESLILVVLLFLTFFGYKASITVMNVSPALSIPMSVVYLIVPFCGALMCLLGAGKIIALLRGSDPVINARRSVE
ncbi:TRAP transporter small permease [Marispirochaeta sp.]|uniref:TRAP transporter small permease n=1 Tax=Marispirochaeta sp. TaxID=2038653 RepID=UPI0029C7689D|nr:TRAP transporter small permease [Marispirochaeta sp.]